MLHLINCGGIVVGNPHGNGTSGGGTTTGSIKLAVVDPMSSSFSQVYFNVKGVHLIGVETSEIVPLPSTKKVNAVQSGAVPALDSIIEIAAATGSYEAIVLELDEVDLINLKKTDGKSGKISNSQQSSYVTIPQEFTVLANATADLEFYIDLDRSFKAPAAGSASRGDGEETYEFDPTGVLGSSSALRTLSGTVSGGVAERVCVYTASADTAISSSSNAPAVAVPGNAVKSSSPGHLRAINVRVHPSPCLYTLVYGKWAQPMNRAVVSPDKLPSRPWSSGPWPTPQTTRWGVK